MIVETRRIEGAGENSEIVTKAPRDRDIISISKEGPDTIQVLKGPSYADHPLVVGPRYIPQDVKIFDVSSLGRDTSGLSGKFTHACRERIACYMTMFVYILHLCFCSSSRN
jgi:hypothetical protein